MEEASLIMGAELLFEPTTTTDICPFQGLTSDVTR
jgi:hypothetical protein